MNPFRRRLKRFKNKYVKEDFYKNRNLPFFGLIFFKRQLSFLQNPEYQD